MEHCEGFGDWLKCARCAFLCAPECPLEGEDVVREFRKRMLGLESASAEPECIRYEQK